MNRDIGLSALEQRLRTHVSSERLQAHLHHFATLLRDSGSEDEWKAAEYIIAQLRSYGVAAQLLAFESLISWPLEGRLETLDNIGAVTSQFQARPRSFGAPTPPEGIEAELVFVPVPASDAASMLGHRAAEGEYDGLDVRGKIVLTQDGGPGGILRAQARGAVGHIHSWPSDEPVVHEMIATSVWGTPTPATAAQIPAIPVLGVSNASGQELAARVQAGPLRVRMVSLVHTAWMRVPLPVADVPGGASSDFLLVGGHLDSWYEGITDNATGDACLLEMARVLSAEREQLRRGVRLCWWPGHSTGRYSGSTWYADQCFIELREHSLAYLNIDSPGVRGAGIWDCRYNCGEVEHITRAVVEELSGLPANIRRPVRAGDQSFLGVGLPSMGAFRMLPLDHPDRKSTGGSGSAWWWHSPEDTLDKADVDILASDTAIYLTLAARLCMPAVIPYRFGPCAQDFIERLNGYQLAIAGQLDLAPVIAAAEAFRDAAQRLDAGVTPADVEWYNADLKRLSRLVNAALLTIHGPYEMDPGTTAPVLPGLAPALELARLDPASDEYRFLHTAMVRQRNRVHDALLQAHELAARLAST